MRLFANIQMPARRLIQTRQSNYMVNVSITRREFSQIEVQGQDFICIPRFQAVSE